MYDIPVISVFTEITGMVDLGQDINRSFMQVGIQALLSLL